MNRINEVQEILKKAKRIVALTGAGFSVASGIPDFRSSKGLYQQQDEINPETILSHSYFVAHPDLFYQFYFNKMIYEEALPNEAHKALKKLEDRGQLLGIVTQNIDNLHQLAGNSNVYELHGSVYRNRCCDCQKEASLSEMKKMEVPRCSECGGIIKPDVVLYEEPLNYDVLEGAINIISKADVLLVMGTSLLVNPAASLVRYFCGKYFIIINQSPTPYDSYASFVIREPVEKILPTLIG